MVHLSFANTNTKQTNTIQQMQSLNNFYKSINDRLQNINRNKTDDVTIMSACKNNNIEYFKYIIEHGWDVNSKYKYKWTALFFACCYGCIDIVKLLLEHKADRYVFDKYCCTCLCMACKYGHENIVKLLLEDDYHMDDKNIDIFECIHAACEEGHTNILNMLLNHDKNFNINASINASKYTETSYCKFLITACSNGHYDIVKILIDRGANISNCDVNEITPLGHVCIGRLEEATYGGGNEYLYSIHIKHKKNDNNDDDDDDKYNYCKTAELLLMNGAYVHNKDERGNTYLHYVCNTIKPYTTDLLKLLIEYGADVNHVNDNRNTCIHNICDANRHIDDHGEGLIYLLSLCDNVHQKNNCGETYLHLISSRHNSYDATKFLIEKGLNVLEKNKYDTTCLSMACFTNGNHHVIELSIEKGILESLSSSELNSCLTLAYNQCNFKAFKLLIGYKADIRACFKKNTKTEKSAQIMNPVKMKKKEEMAKYLNKESMKRAYILSCLVNTDVFKHYFVKKMIEKSTLE